MPKLNKMFILYFSLLFNGGCYYECNSVDYTKPANVIGLEHSLCYINETIFSDGSSWPVYEVILPNSENIYIVENQKTYHFFVYLTFDGGSSLPTIETNRYSITYDSNEIELSPLFDEHEESLSYRFGLEYKMSIIKENVETQIVVTLDEYKVVVIFRS